jgi:hypothetical protein
MCKFLIKLIFQINIREKIGNAGTSYDDKKLPLSIEMRANADIITDDLRLIEQFLQPMKKIFKNNF